MCTSFADGRRQQTASALAALLLLAQVIIPGTAAAQIIFVPPIEASGVYSCEAACAARSGQRAVNGGTEGAALCRVVESGMSFYGELQLLCC